MDASYPVILNNKNVIRRGNIKELTLLELQRETRRLFRDEYDKSTVAFETDDDQHLELGDDDDIETEWEGLNGEESDNDEDDDEDDDEDKEKTPLRIKVLFTIKKVIIKSPKPVGARVPLVKSTTAVFEWRIGTHKLDKRQVSSLKFEVRQLKPTLQQNDGVVVECNPITNSDEKYNIKVSGLTANTHHKFEIRSVLLHENEIIKSEPCDSFTFTTTKCISMKPNQLPTSIPPPTDLQVVALYPDSCILAWNHVTNDVYNGYDFEYYIEENNTFAGENIAATEDSNFVRVVNLMPSTNYTFVCKAKYYDPERKLSDLYFQNTAIVSPPTNPVTVITPEQKTGIDEYTMRPINKPRWVKRGSELELFWSAPETFYGKIEYELVDKIQNKILGTANKLPVTIATGDDKSIFGKQSGKYTIAVRPIFIDSDDEKGRRSFGKPYDIQITIDDDREDASSESMLQLMVRFQSANETRVFKIDTTNCDFERFRGKIFKQFKLEPQKLQIQIRIPSGVNDALESMDINNQQLWQSFISNHAAKFFTQNRQANCFIETILEAPSNLRVNINEKQNQFSIRFNGPKAQKYQGEVECKRSPQSTGYVDLGDNMIRGNVVPLVYTVDKSHEYFYFRFRIKCMNPGIDSSFSSWTQWQRLATPKPKQQQQKPQPSYQQQSYQQPSSYQAQSPLQGGGPLSYSNNNNSNNNNNGNYASSPLQHGGGGQYNQNSSSYNNNNNNNNNNMNRQQSPLQGSGASNNYNAPSGSYNNYNSPMDNNRIPSPMYDSNNNNNNNNNNSNNNNNGGVLGGGASSYNNNGNNSAFSYPSSQQQQQQQPPPQQQAQQNNMNNNGNVGSMNNMGGGGILGGHNNNDNNKSGSSLNELNAPVSNDNGNNNGGDAFWNNF